MSELLMALAIGCVVGIFYTISKNIEIMVTLLQEIEKHTRFIGNSVYGVGRKLEKREKE